MRTKSKWSPGPGIKVQSVVSSDEGKWVVSACGASSGMPRLPTPEQKSARLVVPQSIFRREPSGVVHLDMAKLHDVELIEIKPEVLVPQSE
jgi:hypothetical protein